MRLSKFSEGLTMSGKKFLLLLISLLFVSSSNLFAQDNYNIWGHRREFLNDNSYILKFGQNTDIDIAAEEDVWSVGGTFVVFPDDSLIEVICDSTQDDTSGVGALTVEVFGIDSSWARVSETIGVGGQDSVALVNQFLMIYRARVITVGTNLVNFGRIIFRTQVGETIIADIPLGYGQTLMAIAPVPAGYTGYITGWQISNGTAAADVTGKLFIKPFGNSYQIKGIEHSRAVGTSAPFRPFVLPIKVAAKSLIKISASTDTDNSSVTADFDVVLINRIE